jgi:catechol 2,3-dioxygenase-like lactoylglutathione lyase family enzyme
MPTTLAAARGFACTHVTSRAANETCAAFHAGRAREDGRMPAIDHVDIRVSDVAASRAFYEAALAPLGWSVRSAENDPAGAFEVAFGDGGRTPFALHAPSGGAGQDTVTTGAHIAFEAASREAVQQFHAAACARGGRDIGPPGPRPEYSERYYGAFVLDPDGNNVEAVWHAPEGTSAAG